MKKSINILTEVVTAVSMVAPFAISNVSQTFADTVETSQPSKSTVQNQVNGELGTSANLSPETVDVAKKYISVKDNQYVLDPSIKNVLNPQQYQALQDKVSESNSNVKLSNAVIGKDLSYTSTPLLRSSNRHYTWKSFAWGTRYYFRSNAAVYEMDHDLETMQVVGGVLSLGLFSAYYAKIESDLNYMNNTHPHNYLYMDINQWVGNYTIGVL